MVESIEPACVLCRLIALVIMWTEVFVCAEYHRAECPIRSFTVSVYILHEIYKRRMPVTGSHCSPWRHVGKLGIAPFILTISGKWTWMVCYCTAVSASNEKLRSRSGRFGDEEKYLVPTWTRTANYLSSSLLRSHCGSMKGMRRRLIHCACS
jgi:hypothetical protein